MLRFTSSCPLSLPLAALARGKSTDPLWSVSKQLVEVSQAVLLIYISRRPPALLLAVVAHLSVRRDSGRQAGDDGMGTFPLLGPRSSGSSSQTDILLQKEPWRGGTKGSRPTAPPVAMVLEASCLDSLFEVPDLVQVRILFQRLPDLLG